MKRYASHFLFLPGQGYLKQYVIETEEGCVVRIFPLAEEIENVEWLPGAIVLLNQEELKELDEEISSITAQNYYTKIREDLLMNSGRILEQIFNNSLINSFPPINGTSRLLPVYFSNFDIKEMMPVAGTPHKLLQ